MAETYVGLQLSPRKKRAPPSPDSDSNTYTPKKLRRAPPTPPSSVSRKEKAKPKNRDLDLPSHLSRLLTVYTGLQHALSHALATCAVSPTSDTGIVRNVLNHLSLSTYTGLTTQFDADDLRRLCWIWEWNGKKYVSKSSDEDNPFLETSAPKEWTRGAMGMVISQATHYSKTERKRVAAYGIGIEVEMNIDKDMGGGMAAVARWTAAAETRKAEFRDKLQAWVKINSDTSPVPQVPLADLPQLSMPVKASSLTRVFASVSPKGSGSAAKFPTRSSSPTPSSLSSPRKRGGGDFAIPFPILSTSRPGSPTKSSIGFPKTPSTNRIRNDSGLLTPRTPSSSDASASNLPTTPTTQRGRNAATAPQTPTTSRREALFERVRQRSLSASPSKNRVLPSSEIQGGSLTRDQMLKLGQDEMRRRVLLGRLGGVAESVWMMFSAPSTSTTASPMTRKRRALPMSEVAHAVIKSSPVPVSAAEANESLGMLVKLCPFFLRQKEIGKETWLEMPSTNTATAANNARADQPEASPSKRSSPLKGLPPMPPSPSRRKVDSADEVLTRSPRTVKMEAGGLRQVREIIRRELEIQD